LTGRGGDGEDQEDEMILRELLHAKRLKSEQHIRELEEAGKAGNRYTATMPDMPFLFLALLCDVGWIMQLIAGIIHLTNNFNFPLLLSLINVLFGVSMTIYLDAIQEKVFALCIQKDLSFGLTVFSGLAGGILGIFLNNWWIVIGGFLNFAAGFPLYLSFKPGIRYGIK